MTREVFFFRDSPVAARARRLPRPFRPRPLDRGSFSDGGASKGGVWLADPARDARALSRLARKNASLRVVYVGKPGARLPGGQQKAATLVPASDTATLARALQAAFENLELAGRLRQAQAQLHRSRREIEELNRIGIALSTEKDVQKLLDLILRASREITSADAGALYLVEQVSETDKRLRFKLTQNETVPVSFSEFTMPMDRRSIAGNVAVTGDVLHIEDVYDIPSNSPFQFNRRFDEETGYRTKSMLTIPMKNQKGEVLGVLQLINCKRDPRAPLDVAQVEEQVISFEPRLRELASSLASQAAVAYENTVLYQSIETLFEGFVKAAVTAIEQRDPTTSGHSFRVSRYTCGLAEVVDRIGTGPYAGLQFTREQMKEIRYAALLHDFGKVGVREEVLVKAKKLYPAQIEILSHRFDFITKAVEAEFLKKKVEAIERGESGEALQRLDEECRSRLAELEDYYNFILQCNEPTVLPEGNFERLLGMARRTYHDARGVERNYLTPAEVRFLSIPKGSLDPDERLQIESHVIHTFNFLAQIPWTREIKEIPAIARAHHEKLDGSGYPYKLAGDQIPVQTKMMTISDIFDALSASDRPYKKAVPIDRALDILAMEVKAGQLDRVLFELFVDAKIFQLASRPG